MSRIGLLVPSSNTAIEPDFYRALPAAVTLHVARLAAMTFAREPSPDATRDVETQSRNLASAGVDAIVLGSAAPGFVNGLDFDRRITRQIEAAAGKRAATASRAFAEALQHLGVGRVGLGGAGSQEAHVLAASFLAANGIQVTGMDKPGIAHDRAGSLRDITGVCELARSVDRPEAEAIVLACDDTETLDAIERLERELGKPVVSTAQAALWAALRMAGGVKGVAGYGRLLRDLTAPSLQTQLA